jgi:hypothetical protein
MDVLPVQGSAVPSERVFSSAAETDSTQRNRLSPEMMEALQMLKFSYKRKRLHFGRMTKEEELALLEVAENVPGDVDWWVRYLKGEEQGMDNDL